MGLGPVLSSSSSALAQGTDDAIRVYLVTVGSGDALWTRFGHTGLVIESETSGSNFYNYGVAPFHRPDFIWGFLRGQSQYELDRMRTVYALGEYQYDDRTVRVQRLNLTAAQATRLEEFLRWNYLPENRYYYYNHLWDNCATRVRDALDLVTDGAISRAVADWPAQFTYRDLTVDAVRGHLHQLIGLDMAAGPNEDRVISAWEQLFLPAHLKRAVEQALVDPERGVLLAEPAVVVYVRVGPEPKTGSRNLGRILIMCVALIVALAAWRAGSTIGRPSKSGVWSRLGGVALLLTGLVMGVIGAAFLLLGVVSVVPDTHWNENTWVFWPLDIWLLAPGWRWLRRKYKQTRWLVRYLDLRLGLLLGYVLLKLAGVFVQVNWAFVAASALVLVGARMGLKAQLLLAPAAVSVVEDRITTTDDATEAQVEPGDAELKPPATSLPTLPSAAPGRSDAPGADSDD